MPLLILPAAGTFSKQTPECAVSFLCEIIPLCCSVPFNVGEMAFHVLGVLHHDCCNCLPTVMKLVQLPAQGRKHQKEHQLPVIHSSDFILASLLDISGEQAYLCLECQST